MKIGFIGGGNMAEAILSGMTKDNLKPIDLMVTDISKERCEHLQRTYGIAVLKGIDLLAQSDVVVFAVKPQYIGKVLEEYKGHIRKEHILVSIAAGISLDYLYEKTGVKKIIRAMPNTPALIGKGISALCKRENVFFSPNEISTVEGIFQSVGEFLWLEERDFNAVTALSGSGPAYVYRFVDSLIDSGVLIGLPRPLARKLVIETVLGGILMVKETGENPKELEGRVTSPGGTTIHGLMAMENNNFSNAIKEGVQAAYERAIELGRES